MLYRPSPRNNSLIDSLCSMGMCRHWNVMTRSFLYCSAQLFWAKRHIFWIVTYRHKSPSNHDFYPIRSVFYFLSNSFSYFIWPISNQPISNNGLFWRHKVNITTATSNWDVMPGTSEARSKKNIIIDNFTNVLIRIVDITVTHYSYSCPTRLK